MKHVGVWAYVRCAPFSVRRADGERTMEATDQQQADLDDDFEEIILAVEIEYVHPLSLLVLRDACAVLKLDLDDVLQKTAEALKEFSPTLAQAQDALDVILSKPLDLDDYTPEQAEVLAGRVLADFFGYVWGQRLKQQIRLSLRSLKRQGFRQKQTPSKRLRVYSFK